MTQQRVKMDQVMTTILEAGLNSLQVPGCWQSRILHHKRIADLTCDLLIIENDIENARQQARIRTAVLRDQQGLLRDAYGECERTITRFERRDGALEQTNLPILYSNRSDLQIAMNEIDQACRALEDSVATKVDHRATILGQLRLLARVKPPVLNIPSIADIPTETMGKPEEVLEVMNDLEDLNIAADIESWESDPESDEANTFERQLDAERTLWSQRYSRRERRIEVLQSCIYLTPAVQEEIDTGKHQLLDIADELNVRGIHCKDGEPQITTGFEGSEYSADLTPAVEDDRMAGEELSQDFQADEHGLLLKENDPSRYQPPSDEELKRRCTTFQLPPLSFEHHDCPLAAPESVADLISPDNEEAVDSDAIWSKRFKQEMHDKIVSWCRMCEKAFDTLPEEARAVHPRNMSVTR